MNDDADDIEEIDVESIDDEKDRQRLIASAAIRKPARVMLAAFVVSTVAVLFNLFVVGLLMTGLRMFDRKHSLGLMLSSASYLFLLGLIAYAALQLFRAGSRGYIVTGIVANALLALDFSFRALSFAVFVFGSDDPARQEHLPLMLGSLAVNGAATLGNLLAARFAVRAVRHPEMRVFRRM